MDSVRPLTLYELNGLLRETIETTLTGTYWVEAELSEAREVRGHCYMELIQKEPFSPTPVARASAKCWHSTWSRLRVRFERVTGQTIHAGMKVLLAVTANYHEAYGFSWIVQDIDPTYTLGDMARKRLEIIKQLKAEGVFDLQRELTLPVFAQHIAVISSEGAAGYGDFCNQLAGNNYGYAFMPTLFPAVMQGEQVEQSVIAALNAINSRLHEFDCVVIIRGGGATADLSGFDTLSLAENVANFPLPVITGIGHERDESILDMVANTRVKTPTAAAAYLIDHLAQTDALLEDCRIRIADRVQRVLEERRQRLDRCAGRIPMLFSLVKTREEARLTHLAVRLANGMLQQVEHEGYTLSTLNRRLDTAVRQRLLLDHHRLEQYSLRLQALDPQILLRRGYSITTLNGHVVTDATQVKKGDEIVTRVEKGTLTSIIK